MLPRTDSRLGTLVGLAVVAVAVGGSVLFDWEWGSGLSQPAPLAIGVVAALVAVGVTMRLVRD